MWFSIEQMGAGDDGPVPVQRSPPIPAGATILVGRHLIIEKDGSSAAAASEAATRRAAPPIPRPMKGKWSAETPTSRLVIMCAEE